MIQIWIIKSSFIVEERVIKTAEALVSNKVFVTKEKLDTEISTVKRDLERMKPHL